MNWRLIAPLGLFGPCIGTLTVLGVIPRGVDRFLWFGVVVVCAWIVARREPGRAPGHGALLGFWNGASSTLVQALFVRQLAANNPWITEAFANQPRGFDLEFFVFMLVPFIGVAGGGVTGFLAMLFARWRSSRRGAAGGGETAP
jgi:hypothetical protein